MAGTPESSEGRIPCRARDSQMASRIREVRLCTVMSVAGKKLISSDVRPRNVSWANLRRDVVGAVEESPRTRRPGGGDGGL